MSLESSLSIYQCTLLPICTVAIVQLLHVIGVLTVNISVHDVTNLYGSHSTVTVCNCNLHPSHCPSSSHLPCTSSLTMSPCTVSLTDANQSSYNKYLACASLRTATSYCAQIIRLGIFLINVMNEPRINDRFTHTHTSTIT
jgi:hypothetical protein